jgi:hypothetical protein
MANIKGLTRVVAMATDSEGGLHSYRDVWDCAGLLARERATLAGPRGVVERILNALAQHGIDVVVAHDLEPKAAYDALHAPEDSRITLLPLLDRKAQPSASARDLCLFLKKDDRLIASCCARLRRLTRTMAEHIEDLSLFYEDPGMAPNDELWLATATPARTVLRACTVAFLCGGHIEQAFSKSESGGFGYDALQRLTRIMILSHWDIAYMTSFNWNATTAKVGLRRYGHQGAHPYVRSFRGDELIYDSNLMVSSAEYMRELYFRPEAGDAARPILETSADQLRAVRERRQRSYLAGERAITDPCLGSA